MEIKFKVGDRVNNFRYGDGTIIDIKNEGLPNLVEFDEENMELHNGKYKGKDNHCYWFNNDEITLIPKENKKENKPNIKLVGFEDFVTKKEFEEFKKSMQNNQPITIKEEKPKDRAVKGEKYWLLYTDGSVAWSIDYYDVSSNYCYKMGNYYLTKAECERAKEIQDILIKYSYNFSLEELEDFEVPLYYISTDRIEKRLIADNYISYADSTRFFKTETECEKAIYEIGYSDYIKYCVTGCIK